MWDISFGYTMVTMARYTRLVLLLRHNQYRDGAQKRNQLWAAMQASARLLLPERQPRQVEITRTRKARYLQRIQLSRSGFRTNILHAASQARKRKFRDDVAVESKRRLALFPTHKVSQRKRVRLRLSQLKVKVPLREASNETPRAVASWNTADWGIYGVDGANSPVRNIPTPLSSATTATAHSRYISTSAHKRPSSQTAFKIALDKVNLHAIARSDPPPLPPSYMRPFISNPPCVGMVRSRSDFDYKIQTGRFLRNRTENNVRKKLAKRLERSLTTESPALRVSKAKIALGNYLRKKTEMRVGLQLKQKLKAKGTRNKTLIKAHVKQLAKLISSMKQTKTKCGICYLGIDMKTSEPWISCGICNRPVHCKCDSDRTVLDIYRLQRKAAIFGRTCAVVYKCPGCRHSGQMSR